MAVRYITSLMETCMSSASLKVSGKTSNSGTAINTPDAKAARMSISFRYFAARMPPYYVENRVTKDRNIG